MTRRGKEQEDPSFVTTDFPLPIPPPRRELPLLRPTAGTIFNLAL
ncbi:unnamed protein product [Discula destructiva]